MKPGWTRPPTTSESSYQPPFTTPKSYLPNEPVSMATAPNVTVSGANSTCQQSLGGSLLHSFQDAKQWINPATLLFLLAFLIQIFLVARCCFRSSIKAQLKATEDAYRSSLDNYKKSQDDLQKAHSEMINLLKDPEKSEMMRNLANNRKITEPPFSHQPLRPPTIRNQNFKQSTKKPSLEDRNGHEALPIGFQNIPLNTLSLKREEKTAAPAHLEEDDYDLPPPPATSNDDYEIPNCCQFPSQPWPTTKIRSLPKPPPP